MDEQVLAFDVEEYFINEALLSNSHSFMSSEFLSSPICIQPPIEIDILSPSRKDRSYTVKRKIPSKFSTYNIKKTCNQYTLYRNDNIYYQEKALERPDLPSGGSSLTPASWHGDSHEDNNEETTGSEELGGDETITAPAASLACRSLDADLPQSFSQTVTTEEMSIYSTPSTTMNEESVFPEQGGPIVSTSVPDTYETAVNLGTEQSVDRSAIYSQLEDKEDSKRKSASPVAGPPPKKEKIKPEVRLLGLSHDLQFEDKDYNHGVSLPRNINSSVERLGSAEAATIKSSTFIANYLDPDVKLVTSPDPSEDNVASALYLCNVLTSRHLARMDNENANLRATNKLLLEEKAAIVEKASVSLNRHAVEGRNVKDYNRLRHQLSEDREVHLVELQSSRAASRARVDQVLQEKEELVIKERQLRELMATSMETNFNLQISMMETSHKSVTSFLKRKIEELQGMLSSELALPDAPQNLQELENLRKQLLEAQNLCDSKDAVIASLTSDNAILTEEIVSVKSSLSGEQELSSCLTEKLEGKVSLVESLNVQIKDDGGVITSLHALIEKLKIENQSVKQDSQDYEKVKLKLSEMSEEFKRLVKVETDFKEIKKTTPDSARNYETLIEQMKYDLGQKDGDLKALREKLVLQEEGLNAARDANTVLKDEILTHNTNQLRSAEDILDLKEEIAVIKAKLTQEISDKLDLLETHREEKKSLRRTTDNCQKSEGSVTFQRQPFTPVASAAALEKPDAVFDSGSTPKSLSPPGGIPVDHDEEHMEPEQEKVVENPVKKKGKDVLFPVYNKEVGFVKTKVDKPAEEVLQLDASEEDVNFEEETKSNMESQPSEDGFAAVTRGSQRGFKKGKEDQRGFKSPSPREDRETGKSGSRTSSRSRSRSSGQSRGRSGSRERSGMSVTEAAGHIQEIKQKVDAYTTHLEGSSKFKESMRSRESEAVKFQKMEDCLTELFKSDNFYEFKEFVKGNKITKRTSKIAKGALPDLREGSKEWEFMQEFPEGKRPENALIHFNNGIIAFRPYCEPFYQAMTVLLAAGGEHKDVTKLLFTKGYEKGLMKDETVTRSVEERKFELLLIVAIAKTYFSLKKGRDVPATKGEKIRCDSAPYTQAWANELTSMLDNDVNQASYRTLMPLFVETQKCAAAVRAFYRDLKKLKERKENKEKKFQPW